MQRALKATRSERRRPDLGQHIYAYCNIRTRQVLYSLYRSLHPSRALKQLPDLGPNTIPPKLRKDVWQPFFTLSLPPASTVDPRHESTPLKGSKPPVNTHGLEAFRRLREYRRLHELTWTPSLELARLHNEDEIKKFQEKLDERGGNKTETPHDLIKREKKKLRRRNIMDQKANSVADLAAALLGLEKAWARREEVLDLLRQARKVRRHGLERAETEITRLREGLKRRMENMPAKKDPGYEEKSRRVKQVQVALYLAEHNKAKAEFAAQAVKEVYRRMALSLAALAHLKQLAGATGRRPQNAPITGTKSEASEAEAKENEAERQVEKAALESEMEGIEDMRPLTEFATELSAYTPTDLRQLFERLKLERDFMEQDLGYSERDYLDSQTRQREDVYLRDGMPLVDSKFDEASAEDAKVETNNEVVEDGPRLDEFRRLLSERMRRASVSAREHTLSTLEQEGAEITDELRLANTIRARFEILEYTLTAAGIDPTKGDIVLPEPETESELEIESTSESSPMSENDLGQESDLESANLTESDLDRFFDHWIPTWHALLPSFPRPATSPVFLPPRVFNRINRPEHLEMKDVKVEWANILDAEFAQAWPPAVRHEYMGFVRHIAKQPEYTPKMTASHAKPEATRWSALENGIEEENIDEAIGSRIESEAEQRDLAARTAKRSKVSNAAAEKKKLMDGLAKSITAQIMGATEKPAFPNLGPSKHLLRRVDRLKNRRTMAVKRQHEARRSTAAT